MRAAEDAGWAERATQALIAVGHRQGGARRAILDLLEDQACALSIHEIQERLDGDDREVSRASVYRVIAELELIGLLQRVEVGRGVARYEPAGRGARHHHHHHLVCDVCGQVEPFTDDGLERAIRRLSARLPRRVSDHEIVIRGACRDCSEL